jgi:hypothetical protein
MVVPNVQRITIELDLTHLPHFYPLLQKGVAVPAVVGCSFKSLLCDQFAIPEQYVTDRITTIFLDNHPVDDLEHAIIQDGSRVALSAAMPGLVGATMRRGGFYAALRQGISQLSQNDSVTTDNGTVTLKLFNLLLAELGPLLLARGIILQKDERDELQLKLPELSTDTVHGNEKTLLTVTFR